MRWVMMGPSSGSTDSPQVWLLGVGSPCTVIVPVPRAVEAWFVTEPLSGVEVALHRRACPSAGWPSAPSRFTLTGTEGGCTPRWCRR